jgi:hypothetical protein
MPSDSLEELTAPENVSTNARDFWLERAAWAAMLLAVIAAALGLLGPGPLSWRTARSEDGRIEIEYDAIARYEAPSTLRIQMSPASGKHELHLSRAFVDAVKVEQFIPEPAAMAVQGDTIAYTFAADRAERLRVVVRYKHQEFGSRSGVAALADGSVADFQQFVFP